MTVREGLRLSGFPDWYKLDSVIGKQVEWQGWIDNVKSYESWTGETGHYKILIDMDDPSTFFSTWDVKMTTKDSSAMNLEKDMAVTFNGTIKDILSLGKIEMDVNVLKGSHEKIDPKAVSEAQKQKQQYYEEFEKEIDNRREKARRIENQNGHAYGACKNAVKSMLKSPSTAKFPWMDWNYNVLPDGKTATIQSHVDSQNAMGGTVRTKFICTGQYLGKNNWSIKDVKTY